MTAGSWGWWFAAFLVALDIVIRVTAIIVIPRNRRGAISVRTLR